ncbi:MAG: hypothetical protein V3U09_01790, partial [Thermoplasmata archaeon]
MFILSVVGGLDVEYVGVIMPHVIISTFGGWLSTQNISAWCNVRESKKHAGLRGWALVTRLGLTIMFVYDMAPELLAD